jgi:hypothetical protein
MAALVDLRNADAAWIAFENRRRVIEAFSEPVKPDDTGRTEVQGACLFTGQTPADRNAHASDFRTAQRVYAIAAIPVMATKWPPHFHP